MGQTIEIRNTTVVDDVLMVDTDRSLAGQDGETFETPPSGEETFPARLAERLFGAIDGIDRVFVMSNLVSIRKPSGWSDTETTTASRTISEFFRFYL